MCFPHWELTPLGAAFCCRYCAHAINPPRSHCTCLVRASRGSDSVHARCLSPLACCCLRLMVVLAHLFPCTVQVHYFGWGAMHDEWIALSSGRLAPPRSKSRTWTIQYSVWRTSWP